MIQSKTLFLFFRKVGSPIYINEIEITTERKKEIIYQYNKNKITGMHHLLNEDDHKMLADLMFS